MYKTTIDNLCKNVHTGLIDFSKPRTQASLPTQASSEFITNKQQGDWAEDVIFRAINNNSDKIVAVHYGKSDNLVAGDPDFETFFKDYQTELDTIGKRPDLLLFRREDFDETLGHDISLLKSDRIGGYVTKAIAGIEVRSSAFLMNKYTEEENRIVREHTEKALAMRDEALANYHDLLEQKRPELIPVLQRLDEVSVRSINYLTPFWRSSQRLQELSSLLSGIKKSLRVIQKRHTLSLTPKAEDLKVVHKWIMTYNVPHFYVQVFFDKVYGISFKKILELVSNPDLEGEKFFVERDNKNQNKTTIKVPPQNGYCLAQTVIEPNHHSIRKELSKGRLLFYVEFDGGEASLDKENFEKLFDCSL